MTPMTRTLTRTAAVMLIAALVLPGCDDKTRKKTVITPSRNATAATAPSEATKLLAHVNGQAIRMDKLYDALLQDYGLSIAQQIIADELVRQELKKRKLPAEVTTDQIESESLRALGKIFQFDRPAKPLSAKQMENLLSELLSKKNLTRRMWDATMARNARLARLAGQDVTVSEDDIRQAFFEQYDGKLKVRHIQTPDVAKAERILRKIRAGADFEQLAFKHSTNPSGKTGGWLPEIGPRSAPTNVPPVIVEAVRALKKPGQVSNIVQVGSNCHLLKLEEIIPPSDVKFRDVKDRMRLFVRDRKIDQLQPVIMRNLIRNAKIEYVNPIIRDKVATNSHD